MIAHRDDVEGREASLGHLGGTWHALGRAAGSVEVGLQRIVLPPEAWSTPAHVHGREEEIFYVLGGSGLSWQDGEAYEIRAGDCLVHPPHGAAHTLLAGERGLDVLAFGERDDDEAASLPRAGVIWLGTGWVELAGDPSPWEREVAAGPPELPDAPSPRPPGIANLEDVAVEDGWADLGRAAGSRRTGLQHVRVEAGRLHAPPHCHSVEEELFVVLEGDGELELWPRARDGGPPEPERHRVRAGHVVSRPAGTGRAHAFRAGPGGLTLLAYGTRRTADVCFYPRSNKVSLRGVGVIGRIERLGYWEGEEL